MNVKIISTGSYIPEKVLTNDDLAQMVETNDEWIQERTGICSRHVSEEKTAGEMAIEAAKKALEQSELDVLSIDMILVATTSTDDLLPNAACQVQGAIGARNAFCLDVNAACSGFLFALNSVQAYFQAGIFKTALVIGVERLSKIIDWTDRGTCILFGDGAGAVVVRADEDTRYEFLMKSDGTKGDVLTCKRKGCIAMNGQEVFRFAVKQVPACINELLEKTGTDGEQVDWYLLHQANLRIIEAVAKRLKQPLEKFPINLQHYGNTSSASLPILLDEYNRLGTFKRGDTMVLSGFGAGLTWGATLLTW